jgi:hypothetical protein
MDPGFCANLNEWFLGAFLPKEPLYFRFSSFAPFYLIGPTRRIVRAFQLSEVLSRSAICVRVTIGSYNLLLVSLPRLSDVLFHLNRSHVDVVSHQLFSLSLLPSALRPQIL